MFTICNKLFLLSFQGSPIFELNLYFYQLEIARKYAKDWGEEHYLWFGPYYVSAFFPWREGGIYINFRKNRERYSDEEWKILLKNNIL